MATKELTVYEALIEISRIKDKLKNFENFNQVSMFIGFGTQNAKTIKGIERNQFESILQSNYDSITHLIANLAEYKAKLALSNAITKINIGNKEYTIAEALQRKDNIKIEHDLLNAIQSQINMTNNQVTKHNNDVDNCLSDYLEKVKGENSTPEDIEKLTETYNINNKYIVIDPNKIIENINNKYEELETFMRDVDVQITSSNVKTLITVELKD